jgi:CheY-like chemotaxis protein
MERVVAQALDSVRPAAEAKDIRLQAALDSTCHVSGDPTRLQQVVWNLLSNAVKFTPKGGRVQITLQRVDSAMELSVSDSGRGIAPEFLPHVFERFRQAEGGTTRSQSGLGLGLSIVRHLVEAHGGLVSARSGGPGQGATFSVRLPLSIITREREPSFAAQHDFACPPELTGLRILVVDDEPDAREVLDTLLTSCGAVVGTAGSAAEGLRLLEAQTFDLVVSDIGMPEQDGYAFVRMLREVPGAQRLPAIALTAFTRAHDRTRALLAGFQSHVPKPVEPSELLAVIASLARDRVRSLA